MQEKVLEEQKQIVLKARIMPQLNNSTLIVLKVLYMKGQLNHFVLIHLRMRRGVSMTIAQV
jgi:hypothetical protein